MGISFSPFYLNVLSNFSAFWAHKKNQSICGTLFSNFGDEALLDSLVDSKAKGVITKKSFFKEARLHQRKAAPTAIYSGYRY
jgi:acetyl-CoA synthetase